MTIDQGTEVTRFLAIPKVDQTVTMLNIAQVRFTKQGRESQIASLREVQSSARSESRARFQDTLARGIVRSHVELELVGVHVMDADTVNRKEIADAFPEFHLIEDERFALIEPNKSESGVSKRNLDLWHLNAIGLATARKAGFDGHGDGVGVAVLDTGIDAVPEIAGRIKAAYSLNPAGDAWKRGKTHDTHGHGTHVAGLIAGSTAGVAPGAELINVIALPGGSGTMSGFVSAIELIAGSPEISILNLSAGIPGYRDGMHSAIAALLRAGVLPVVAIGNEGRNTSRSPGNYREVISVGAINKAEKVANFSGGGSMVVENQSYPVPDLVAPGEGVTSCVKGTGFESWNGTSMATPIVSGVAALILERHPTISEPDLQGELLESVRTLPDIPESRQGEGLVQLGDWAWNPVA